MEVMMGQSEGNTVYQRSMVDSFMESIALESILFATNFILSLGSFLNESGILEMFNRDASRLDEPTVIGSEGKILRLVSSCTAPDVNGKDIAEAPVDDGETDDDDDDDGDEQDDDAEEDEDDDDEEGADDKNNPEEEDDDDEVEANGQGGDDDDEDDDDEDDDDDDDDGGEEDDDEDEEEDEEEAPEPPAKKRK